MNSIYRNTLLVLFSSFFLSSCAKSPRYLVEERYQNLNEVREVEKVFNSEHTVIFIGKKNGKKCDEVETIVITDLNTFKVWKIYKARNERYCKSDKINRVKEKYLEWVRVKNLLK